jgi:phosphoribosylamine--glycine ligase
MKVLVLGGGGREHAIVWKLLQSPRVKQVYCAPGNGGIAAEPNVECIAWDGKDIDSILGIASTLQPQLVIVGPEVPLMLGVVDEMEARGLRVFGPKRAAAELESSKAFAKEFMQRHHIPTAKYAICTNEGEVKDALQHFKGKVVVKADGLAAGKGVIIAESPEEAHTVAHRMLTGDIVGQAGARVVLEEFLEGEELSFLCFADGEKVVALAPAQDHKRIGEGDTGANTGGMGAYSIDSLADDNMREWIIHHIAKPVVRGMKEEGREYKGVLYCGLMMTPRGPEVLEFNTRFGDPETQPILMRMENDLVDACEAAIDGNLNPAEFTFTKDPTVCVVVASEGYPMDYQTGKKIEGIEDADQVPGVKVFHAGTKRDASGSFVTSGGRVLGVSAQGESLEVALQRAYMAIGKIKFDGMYYRRDIGAKALRSTS